MRIDKWYASIYLFFQYYLWNGSFEFMSTVDYFFYVHILRWHYMNQILTNILYRAPDKDSISAKISTFIMFLSCFLLFFLQIIIANSVWNDNKMNRLSQKQLSDFNFKIDKFDYDNPFIYGINPVGNTSMFGGAVFFFRHIYRTLYNQ